MATLEVEENPFVTAIGVINEVRHIDTKNGAKMLIATVESIGFEFRLTIFTKDYEVYAKKIHEDMMIIVEGRVRFDDERGEITISPTTSFKAPK
jgi:DNA polymerase III alpha subunit